MTDRTRRWLIRGGIAAVVLVALGYGAILFYAKVLNDSPDKLDEDDLTAAVNATVPAAPSDPPGTSAASSSAASDPTPPATTVDPPREAPVTTAAPGEASGSGAASGSSFDGTWQVTSASQFGYRVEEVLAGVNTTAVGRGSEIQGSLTIEGDSATAAEFTVDVASITSDSGRRDSAFRGRVMNTEQFPNATFVLTEPVDFGAVPGAGQQLTASASGDLTLHGVTRSVTFDVTAEASERRIGVLGSIPVLFSDYEIPNPSSAVVKTENNGLLEFVLVFERA